MKNMGRPREFDMDEALAAMRDVFWEKGYEGTSISDLMEATGLQKGSLYKAFADKQDIFVQVLGHYVEEDRAEKRAIVDAACSPLEGLEAMLKNIGETCGQSNQYRGCLAINSMMDASAHDEKVVSLLKSTISSGETALAELIQAGQKAGEIRSDIPAKDIGEALYSYIAGMQAIARIARNKVRIQRLVAVAIDFLRPPKNRKPK